MSPRSSFTSDEGAYALQADALGHGTWAYDYKAAPVDPEGRYFPLVLSSRSGDDFYAYIQHPAYPALLRGAIAVAGSTVGLHLLALLGTLGTAVAAWLLAGEVDERLRRAAFWMAALSPALVNGYLLWAHTLAAAVAGLTLVALVRMVRRGPTTGRTAAAVGGLCLGVLLRSEALLFAAAAAAVSAFVAWQMPIAAGPRLRMLPTRVRTRVLRPLRAGLALALLAGLPAAVALTERLWVRRMVDGTYDSFHDRAAGTSWLSGRVTGAWHDLFQGLDVSGSGRVLGPAALVVIVGFGVMALRRWRADSVGALVIGSVAAAGLLGAQFMRYPSGPISGLFVVWPLALLGLILVRWRREAQVVAVLGAIIGTFGVVVVGTEYAAGGGVEWGGRFFLPALAPLAVLAVVGLDRRLAMAPLGGRRIATSLLAVMAIGGAAFGVASVARLRADQGSLVTAVARHRSPVTVTTVPALPRIAWSTNDTVNWMLTDDAGLHDVLTGLRGRGLDEVSVVTGRPGPTTADTGFVTVEELPETDLRSHGLGLYVLRT